MISVLLPMGNSPFFVKACIDNFYNTCGLPAEEVDYHILTTDTSSLPSDRKFKVHRIGSARKRDSSHLKMLDWAVNNLDLHDWVYVTHTDMFWLDEGWLRDLQQFSLPPVVACMMPYSQYRGEFKYNHYKYLLSGFPIIRAHDFSGLYHVPTLRKMQLSFLWGHMGVSPAISQVLRSAVEKGKLYWIMMKRPLRIGDPVDGSDVLGLELVIQGEKIIEAPITQRFVHGWDTLGLADDIVRTGDTIYVHREVEKCHRGLPAYSWISSSLFDRESPETIFPWACLGQLGVYNMRRTALCDVVSKYAETNPIGLDDVFGVKEVKFLDQSWEIK